MENSGSLLILLIIFSFYFAFSSDQGFLYDAETNHILCSAQCEALCNETQLYYNETDCDVLCRRNNIKIWQTSCDHEICPGSCFQKLLHGIPKPKLPLLRMKKGASRGDVISMTWQISPKYKSPLHTLYVVQFKEEGQTNWTSLQSVSTTEYMFKIKNPCHSHMFRVMGINRFGSRGFSRPLQIPAVKNAPGAVTNLTLSDRGLYYNKSADEFMGTIQWHLPKGWNSSDIQFFYWDIRRRCQDINHDALPIIQYMYLEKGFKMLIRISRVATECSYYLRVRAFSQCKVPGPWTNLTINVPACPAQSACGKDVFEPPDNVKNLVIQQENRTQSFGCQVNLVWEMPEDLGSEGKLDHFLIRWGRTDWMDMMMPPEFSRPPQTLELNSTARELTLVITDCQYLCTYGFQVIPVAPSQVIDDLDLYPIHRISGTAKDCQNSVIYQNDDGSMHVVVIHPAHSPFVEVQWFPMNITSKDGAFLVKGYGIQWGAVSYNIKGDREFNVLQTTRLPYPWRHSRLQGESRS